MSIGNIDQVYYNNIRKFKSFDGDRLSPNNETYSTLVENIRSAIREIGEDCRNPNFWAIAWIPDLVDSDEVTRANKNLSIIFNSFSQAIVNLNDKVNNTKNSDELREVAEDFDGNFMSKVRFEATETQPGYRYISGSSLGPFNAHGWFDDANKREKIGDDNGSYKIIGQLVDRVYGMLDTTIHVASDIITKKKEILNGKGENVTPPSTTTGETPQHPKPGATPQPTKPGETPAKTIEQKIRSLVTQKNRLAQRQASLIKTIRALTSEARTLYVRQFLNEDEASSSKGTAEKPANQTSAEQPPAKTSSTASDSTSAKTKEVDSNNPIYIGLTELITTKNRIEAYYNTSLNYFENNIAKRAKYLKALMSGELRSNMSAEDRINALNNFNYRVDNTKTKVANDTQKTPTTPTPPVTTPVPPSSDTKTKDAASTTPQAVQQDQKTTTKPQEVTPSDTDAGSNKTTSKVQQATPSK